MKLRLTVLSALAISGALLAAGPAVAKSTKTEVHNYYVTNSLSGAAPDYAAFVDIDSKSSKCERKRKATLFYKGDKVGTGKTNGDGVINALSTGSSKLRTGKYRVEVKKTSGCKAANAEGKLTSTNFKRTD